MQITVGAIGLLQVDLPTCLEPVLAILNIDCIEFLVGHRQVDDTLGNPDNCWYPGKDENGQQGDQQHDNTLTGVAEKELVDTEHPQYDRQQPGNCLLIGVSRLNQGNTALHTEYLT